MILSFFSLKLSAQNNEIFDGDTLVSLNENFNASWFHESLFGGNFREVWTEKVKLSKIDRSEILNISETAKDSNGLASFTIINKSNNSYLFIPLSYNPDNLLPGNLSGVFSGDYKSDLLSGLNPFSPIIINRIFNEIGIEVVKTKLCYLPPSQKSESQKGLSGYLLFLSNLRKYGKQDQRILSTQEMIKKYLNKKDVLIDAGTYLKARLIDICFNEWDKKEQNWIWRQTKIDSNEKLLSPIPTFRPQSFSKIGGILPTSAKLIYPDFTQTDIQYPEIGNIKRGERLLDRSILANLNKSEWDSLTTFVGNKLTEVLLYRTLNDLPFRVNLKTLNYIAEDYNLRRNKLIIKSEELYSFVNEYCDLYATNNNDSIAVNISKNETSVRYSSINSEGKIIPYLNKKLINDDTKEIRIYALKGSDNVSISGDSQNKPIIRIIAIDGGNTYKIKTHTNDSELFPLLENNSKIIIYDNSINEEEFSEKVAIRNDSIRTVRKYYDKRIGVIKDHGHEWSVIPYGNYSTDDGIALGIGPRYTSYGYRTIPFNYQMTLVGAYESRPNSYLVKFNGIFNSFIKNTSVILDAYTTALLFTKYYGFGNETDYSREKEIDDYYKMDQEYLNVQAMISFNYWNKASTKIGVAYENSDIKQINEKLLKDFPYKSYGTHQYKAFSLRFDFNFDSRDDDLIPRNGYYFNLNSEFYPVALSNKENFIKVGIDFRDYQKFQFYSENIFAFRIGGEKIWGKFPFQKAAFLGGQNNLRGFNRERFSGDASLFGQMELRSHITNFSFISPGKIGTILFAEAGRVFAKDLISTVWHPSVGLGAYITFFKEYLVFTGTVGFSSEIPLYYLGTSMSF